MPTYECNECGRINCEISIPLDDMSEEEVWEKVHCPLKKRGEIKNFTIKEYGHNPYDYLFTLARITLAGEDPVNKAIISVLTDDEKEFVKKMQDFLIEAVKTCSIFKKEKNYIKCLKHKPETYSMDDNIVYFVDGLRKIL